jgi:hypothetical protein
MFELRLPTHLEEDQSHFLTTLSGVPTSELPHGPIPLVMGGMQGEETIIELLQFLACLSLVYLPGRQANPSMTRVLTLKIRCGILYEDTLSTCAIVTDRLSTCQEGVV